MNIQRIVNTVFTSNTYVLTENSCPDCWLVDIGDVDPVLECIAGKKVRGILITHTHYDHIYGINKLVELFPDCMVYTSEKGELGLFSEKLNFSRYHADPLVFQGKRLKILKDGEEVSLFPDVTVRVLATPGHDWSCLCYYTEGIIFTGDSYIPGLQVITSFPRSNKTEAGESLTRILKLAESRDIYPGHQEVWLKQYE